MLYKTIRKYLWISPGKIILIVKLLGIDTCLNFVTNVSVLLTVSVSRNKTRQAMYV